MERGHGLDAAERLMVAAWPEALFADDAKAPLVTASKAEFMEAVLTGDHLDEVVVLRHGVDLLGLKGALPDWLTNALDACETVAALVRHVALNDAGAAAAHCARIEYVDAHGIEREAHACRQTAEGSAPAGACDAWRSLAARSLGAVEACEAAGEAALLYACEMRRLRSRGRGGFASKSLLEKSVRDDGFGSLSRWAPMWDVCDDGVFVGGFGSGKGLHMDQCLWANVGANWRGFKLVATWRAGADSKRMVDDFLDVVFSPGLMDARRTEALLSAHRVVLLRPGDCFVSSGGVAHATLVVKGLNLTSYESLVTLHPRLVDHFLSSTDPKLRGSRQAADEDMIDGITRTMARRLEAVSRDPKPGECSYRCAQALRTHYADTVSLLASRGEALDTTVLRAAATFRRAQQEDRKRRKRGRPG